MTAYVQSSSYPVSYLFQGHFYWLDTVDMANFVDDYVSLGWNGNLARTWNGLNSWFESNDPVPWYTQQIFPGQGVVMGFPEWENFSYAAREGFASATAAESSYHGELGNIVFTYHHTWTGFAGASFSASPGPGISFGVGSTRWEKAAGNTFWY